MSGDNFRRLLTESMPENILGLGAISQGVARLAAALGIVQPLKRG
jgi:hypothetical protein